jgi:hypothetical protein
LIYQSGLNAVFSNQEAGAAIFETNNTERMRIDSSGNLLVGRTGRLNNGRVESLAATGEQAFVAQVVSNGNSLFQGFNAAGNAVFYATGNGDIFAINTSITAISDQSLKENIRDLETGLSEVLALRPRRFDWKAETHLAKKDVAGFIAQEVEQILPDLVADYEYSKGNTKKSLKMGDILPTLVKAIQEQQAIIEQLKADVAALKGAQA